MAKVIIDARGNKIYYNDNNEIDRRDGPAIIRKNGTKHWYVNDIASSTNHPCDVGVSGTVIWRINNQGWRHNGPAYDQPNGRKLWCKEGIPIWPKLK